MNLNPLDRVSDPSRLDECLVLDGIRQACESVGVKTHAFLHLHEDEVFESIVFDRKFDHFYAWDMDITNQAYEKAMTLLNREDINESIPF